MKVPSYLKLRNNTWYLQTYVNQIRVRRSLGLPKAKYREAQAKALSIMEKIRKFKTQELEDNPKLEDIFKNYISYKKNHVVSGHLEQVVNHFDCFIKDLDYERIKDIEPIEVSNWLNNYPFRNKIQKIQTNLNAAFNYAVKLGITDKSPLSVIPRVKHRCKTKIALNVEQYREFGKHIWNFSCCSLLLFLIRTGCRFNEASQLKWSDISLEAGKAIIRAENNKTREERTIPLAEDLAAHLKKLYSKRNKNQEYVFVTRKCKPFLKDNVRRAVRKIGNKIGRPDFTTHALRNTFITLTNDAGGNILAIQKMVGHKKMSTTSRYLTLNQQIQKEMLEKLPKF